MDKQLQDLEKRIGKRRDFDTPPLHLWHPELSGDIPIHIDAQGTWYHDGTRIEREALVRLFASILRREEDGHYYLVTPVEKWRIAVALHPLIVTDIENREEGGQTVLHVTLNTGRRLAVDAEHPIFLEPAAGHIATVQLEHGLTALCSRPAWYRLVEMAEDVAGKPAVHSCGSVFPLAPGKA
ncbi:MAG: DUF1285 domain-containing protein [Halioglobus sp.]|nr:DUF1285 domain-containing protein [Halioglobus sp.]